MDDAYRDPLAAAQERIAALERQVEELERERAASPEWRSAYAELARVRLERVADLERARLRQRRALIAFAALAFAGTSVFVGAIASMGSSGHPLAALALGGMLSLALLAIVFAIVRVRVDDAEREVARVDAQTRKLVGAVAEKGRPAMRVAVEPDAPEREAESSRDVADRARRG